MTVNHTGQLRMHTGGRWLRKKVVSEQADFTRVISIIKHYSVIGTSCHGEEHYMKDCLSISGTYPHDFITTYYIHIIDMCT